MNLKKQRFILIVSLVASMVMHLLYGLEGIKQIDKLESYNKRLETQLMDKQEQIEVLEIIIENQKQDTSEIVDEPEYIGTFTISHYCPCSICCNKSDGITYTGAQATEGRTIAVDPEVIPLGSIVIIDGQEYIAEDVGGAIKGNKIDMYMNSHTEALEAGVVQAEVYLGGDSNGNKI